jgi:hypothetical protein
VVKIIFEHWAGIPRLRNAVVCNEPALRFDKTVCIVRDPRDELLSRMLYVILPYTQRHGHQPEVVQAWVRALERKERAPGEVTIQHLLGELQRLTGFDGLGFIRTRRTYLQFLKMHRSRVFVMRYEDFMQGRLAGLQDYLGFELSPERGVDNLTRVVRTVSYDNWKRWFTPDDVPFFRKLLGPIMQRLGYDGWELEQPERLDPEHGSLYVRRLIAELLARSD